MAGCGNNAAENNSTAVNSDNAEGDKVQDQSAEQTGGQEIVVWTQMMDNEAALLQNMPINGQQKQAIRFL